MHPDARDPDGSLEPPVLDVLALRRRVVLTGAVTMVLFLTTAYALAALRASSLWLLPVMVVIWVVVVRPLMAPVRSALRLRRQLAFQAFLEAREQEGDSRG